MFLILAVFFLALLAAAALGFARLMFWLVGMLGAVSAPVVMTELPTGAVPLPGQRREVV
ncbi:hypothetical protein [Wenjunlia tyrosinilytica]|uniref:Uncharacterized protein n=1 Tax=Wenjunlia tyrosinilytica TaxID=1544741 RepID=A0A917ZXC0_9ACTN|nr:hypothetical protein [Wenjunlia tyrosinilytica]GGO98192.1 hypothetical protein GCM10012280_61750 [Wenjunlia tyrosinilytica]